METPLEPGIHHGYTINFSCIIKELLEGEYLVRFGANGRASYTSNGLYHIIVTEPKTIPQKQREPLIPTPKEIKIISPISGKEINLD